jgi:hypothetical protein
MGKTSEPVKPNASGRYRANLGISDYLELNVEAFLQNKSLPDTAGHAVSEYLKTTADDRQHRLGIVGQRVNLTADEFRQAILDGRVTQDLKIITD